MCSYDEILKAMLCCYDRYFQVKLVCMCYPQKMISLYLGLLDCYNYAGHCMENDRYLGSFLYRQYIVATFVFCLLPFCTDQSF